MIKLFRPVGLIEMELIIDKKLKEFPPRLPEQPIFYPVLNKDYAIQIASLWNTKDPASGFCGFVTEFYVEREFASQFETKTVGASIHQELWLPSEMLDSFNKKISGKIYVVDAYYGESFVGLIPEVSNLNDKNAREQFIVLKDIFAFNKMDFSYEVLVHSKIVLLNYRYWETSDFTQNGINEDEKMAVLDSIVKVLLNSECKDFVCDLIMSGHKEG